MDKEMYSDISQKAFESVTDEMCRAANEAYHNGHHGYLGAMHSTLVAAMAVYLKSKPKAPRELLVNLWDICSSIDDKDQCLEYQISDILKVFGYEMSREEVLDTLGEDYKPIE